MLDKLDSPILLSSNCNLATIKEDKEKEYLIKSLYLAKCGHELKNVFLAVSVFLNSFQFQAVQETDDRAKFIHALCNFGMNIVSDINCLCLKDMKPNPMINTNEITKFPLEESLDFCLDIFQLRQKYEGQNNNKVIIKKIYEPNSEMMINSISEKHFKQVLINLISNAYKFTSKGEINISVNYIDNQSKIRIMIQDTGMGMDEHEQEKLFHPFEKTCLSSEINSTGTGLGLYIIQDILKSYNSSLQVQSVKNIGSTFWFDFPIDSSELMNEENYYDNIDEELNESGIKIPLDFNDSIISNVNTQLSSSDHWDNLIKTDSDSTQIILDSKPIIQKHPHIKQSAPLSNSCIQNYKKVDIKGNRHNSQNYPNLINLVSSLKKDTTLRIVVCDDDKIHTSSAKNLITKVCQERNIKNPEIIMTKNGIECIYEIYKYTENKNNIDMLIIDETMPYLSGSQVSQLIKGIPAMNSFPIYLLSSSICFSPNSKADGFIEKPLSKTSLIEVLTKLKKVNNI